MTEKPLSFLVRVWFTKAFESLPLRYELSAQSGGKDTISVYAVNYVAKHQFQCFLFSGTGTRGHYDCTRSSCSSVSARDLEDIHQPSATARRWSTKSKHTPNIYPAQQGAAQKNNGVSAGVSTKFITNSKFILSLLIICRIIAHTLDTNTAQN